MPQNNKVRSKISRTKKPLENIQQCTVNVLKSTIVRGKLFQTLTIR